MAQSTPTDVFPPGVKPFKDRVFPKTICLFDVDGTLSLARRPATKSMFEDLAKLREICAVAIVSGSNVAKSEEQLRPEGYTGDCELMFAPSLTLEEDTRKRSIVASALGTGEGTNAVTETWPFYIGRS